jgi:hypothetical protein
MRKSAVLAKYYLDQMNLDEMGRKLSDGCRSWVVNPNVKRLLGRPSREGRIRLKWILKKCDGRVWTSFIIVMILTSGGLL